MILPPLLYLCATTDSAGGRECTTQCGQCCDKATIDENLFERGATMSIPPCKTPLACARAGRRLLSALTSNPCHYGYRIVPCERHGFLQ
jgi:hypothetical protein